MFSLNIAIIYSKYIFKNHFYMNLPSDEDNDVPSEFPFFRTEEESRWDTDDDINSPPESINALSFVAEMIIFY